MTRRRALRQTFFYSAALALARSAHSVEAETLSHEDLHFLLLGDYGSAGQSPEHTLVPQIHLSSQTFFGPPPSRTKVTWIPQQGPVAIAMQAYVRALGIQPEGLFLLGDNFYGGLRGGVNSPRWKSGFEDMYPASVFPGPCWAALGNHDYDEEGGLKLAAELSYADAHPGTRWTMPSKWHRIDWPAKHPVLTCLVLDSNFENGYLYLSREERARQLSWMKEEMAKPRVAPWFICVGHHPLYSNGAHGDNQLLIKEWGALFEEQNVACYFAGHDHDLQHLEFGPLSTSFVISGGGGAHITGVRKPDRGPYAEAVNGFTHLQINRDRMIVRHLDTQAQQLHAFSKSLVGEVEILG